MFILKDIFFANVNFQDEISTILPLQCNSKSKNLKELRKFLKNIFQNCKFLPQ